jgi:anti-sigma regulatory factor (Ser/Thr protein kinase)
VTVAPGHHNLSIYEDDGHLDAWTAPFLQDGVDAGEAVIAVIDQRKWAVLRELLGPAAESISYLDRDTVYTRPEDALFAYDARLRKLVRDGAPWVRVWGEFPVFTGREQADPWIAYEAILNHAFAHHPVQLMCAYDAREHSDAVLDGARHTHPHVLEEAWLDNPDYHDPAQVVRALAPDAHPLPDLRPLPLPADAAGFRHALLHELTADGVSAPEADNLLVAAGEIWSNAGRHGDGARGLRVGRVNGRFVCEISDHGPGVQDPLTGYLPPRPGHVGGAGVWVARQLTWRLEFVPSGRGLATRLWV